MQSAYQFKILYMLDLIARTKGEDLRAKRFDMLDNLIDSAESDGIDTARILAMAG